MSNTTTTTAYAGIDYGLGQSNVDKANGIRFGVISQHTVGDAWYESAEGDYGVASCGDCGDPAVTYDEAKHGGDEYNHAKHECDEYACEHCKTVFGAESAFGDEPQGYYYDREGYELSSAFDNTEIFVTKSAFYTHAQFCSPCAPGAGNLNHPCEDGPKTYCLGHDWFEDGVAPYPVYDIATGLEVRAMLPLDGEQMSAINE